MINLETLKFIPQKNVESKSPTEEDLLVIKKKEQPAYDLKFNADKQNWTIKKDFLKNQAVDEGWTSAIDPDSKFVFLFKTNQDAIEEMKPVFFKGDSPSNMVKSNYFTFLVTKSGVDLAKTTGFYLEALPSGVSGVTAYVLTTELPKPKPHSLEPQVLTAEKLTQLETPVPQVEVSTIEHTQEELDAAKEYYEKMNEEILPTENVVFEEAVAEDVPLTETPVVPAKQDYTEEPVDDIF